MIYPPGKFISLSASLGYLERAIGIRAREFGQVFLFSCSLSAACVLYILYYTESSIAAAAAVVQFDGNSRLTTTFNATIAIVVG